MMGFSAELIRAHTAVCTLDTTLQQHTEDACTLELIKTRPFPGFDDGSDRVMELTENHGRWFSRFDYWLFLALDNLHNKGWYGELLLLLSAVRKPANADIVIGPSFLPEYHLGQDSPNQRF